MISKKEFFEKHNIKEDNFKKMKLKWGDLVNIYIDYQSYSRKLVNARDFLVNTFGDCSSINSIKLRIKDPEHLIEKIIRKKTEDPSRNINLENYKKEIVDLIGLRALTIYKKEWLPIDEFIRERWELLEKPKLYIRKGDEQNEIEKFTKKGFDIEEHKFGYRSVHYILIVSPSNREDDNYYVEVQTRTLFEEAWSEIDHTIKYPNFGLENNKILEGYSSVLNRLAGSSDEMASTMIETQKVIQEYNNLKFNKIEEKISEIQENKNIIKMSPLKIIISKDLPLEKSAELKKILIDNPGKQKVYFKINGNVVESSLMAENSEKLKKIIRKNFDKLITIVN